MLIGFEAYENLQLSQRRPGSPRYRWPIFFFVAVAFWNLVGAGLFGFLINPPIALYYMQGLNTTPRARPHGAVRRLRHAGHRPDAVLPARPEPRGRLERAPAVELAFWAINIGLALMVAVSLLPIGLLQTWASVEHGMWYARSAEFLQQPLLQTLRWLRVPGDTIFAVGALMLALFIFRLFVGKAKESAVLPQPAEQPARLGS